MSVRIKKLTKQKLVTLVCVALALALGLIWGRGETGKNGKVVDMSDVDVDNQAGNIQIDIPLKYDQPLVVASFNHLLSIQPVDAKNVPAIQVDEQTIKYIDAYPNTDVEQIKYPNKLKESLILKNPNHPEKFEYQIDIDDFIWEVVENGDILFKQKEKEERFEINEVKDGMIKATMNTDYTDGHPIIFKIPAPFLVDVQGNKSSKEYVKTKIEGNKLILIPDKDWIKKHAYPIILDPTVEIVPREQEQVIFGDENSDYFKPKMQLAKWGDETYVSLEYEISEQGQVGLEGNKVKYQTNSDVDVEIYTKDPEEISVSNDHGNLNTFIINEQGGVEFDLILKQKPKTNVFNYKLDSQGLGFHYQAPLDEEEKNNPEVDHCTETECYDKDGKIVVQRPENVVGSYAVYHAKKSGDYTQLGGKNYRAGKAFHIYRPKVYDANGNWVWGELKISQDNSILSVAVDQDWLDNAVYPVRVDPNFGYETVGSSNVSPNPNYIAWYDMGYYPDVDGSLDSMSIYVGSTSDVSFQLGVYKKTGDRAGSLVAHTGTGASVIYSWNTLSISGNIFSSTPYLLVTNKSSHLNVKYDTNLEEETSYDRQTFGSWPATISGPSWNNYEYSIYATYSPSNYTPTISSVDDSPDPVTVGNNITFSVNWADDDEGENIKAKICKTDSLTNQNCDGGYWATSTSFTADDPEEISYETTDDDTGEQDYYAFVCDDEGECCGSSSGAFTVNVAVEDSSSGLNIDGGILNIDGGVLQIR